MTNRIRIAILIVDDKALVYMPHLAFIEEELNELSFPNGFLCNEVVTGDIVRQFEAISYDDIGQINIDNNIISSGVKISLLKNNDLIDDIKNSLDILEKNPAVDAAKLRIMNVYKNNYKILKMQIMSVRINKKSINLKPFNSLLPKLNKRLRSTWQVFTIDDINELQDTKYFEIELNIIKDQFKEYLFDAGRFGYIIDVEKKEDFVNTINKLKTDFKTYLGNEPTKEVKERFEKNKVNGNVKLDLKTILDRSRSQLKNYLLTQCPPFKEFKDTIFDEFRNLKNDFNNLEKPENEIMQEFVVNLYISNKLRFVEVDELIDKI